MRPSTKLVSPHDIEPKLLELMQPPQHLLQSVFGNSSPAPQVGYVVVQSSCKHPQYELRIDDAHNSNNIDTKDLHEKTQLLRRLAATERRTMKLQLQLLQNGMAAITEDIPYDEAKQRITEITQRLQEISPDQQGSEYFGLEKQLERYTSAMVLTDEYQREQDQKDLQWEQNHQQANHEALLQLRRHLPVLARRMTSKQLAAPSPNGKSLPSTFVKRFQRTNVLLLLRVNPAEIERLHPSTLEAVRVTGLTLTERRALHAHLRSTAAIWKESVTEPLTERKYTWFRTLKSNFQEALVSYEQHVRRFGSDSPCSCGTRVCPGRTAVDYSGDYGFPIEDEYEPSEFVSRQRSPP